MIEKDALLNDCRTEATRIITTGRLPEFGVPVNIVADLIEIIACALAASHHTGAISACDELQKRIKL